MEAFASDDAYINQLPDDCLEYIFTFLPISERLKVERVCKRWRIISERGWNDVKELKINNLWCSDDIQLILKRCGFLKGLIIPQPRRQLNYLSMVLEFCRLDNLEMIEIRSPGDDDEEVELNICNLREIFRKTTKLVTVKIFGTHIFNRIDYLYFLNPRTLQTLILGTVKRESSIINLDRFPNLKKLRLLKFTIIGDERERAEESLQNLEKMEIRLCGISKDIMRRIGTLENLQELTLGFNDCDMINEHIRSIARHCHKMKKMSLTCFSTITSECFQYLGEMVSLENLTLENFGDVKFRDMACLINVKRLRFTKCHGNFESYGLIELITNPSNLETLELFDIRSLNITFVNNVARVFHCGQRVKPLRLEVTLASNQEHLHPAWETLDHPLLDLSISFR